MTEASFQQARKLMQQLNHIRGKIKNAKNNIKSWSRQELAHTQNMQPQKAEAAKNNVLRWMENLARWQTMFATIKFPAHDLPNELIGAKFCRICQDPIQKDWHYCLTCYENQNIPKYDIKNRDDKDFSE